MDINILFDELLNTLSKEKHIQSCKITKVAGIPFLYIHTYEIMDENDLIKLIEGISSSIIKNKRITYQTIFVRKESDFHYVFRHRFFVPQEKMFCCGHFCVDCILHKK